MAADLAEPQPPTRRLRRLLTTAGKQDGKGSRPGRAGRPRDTDLLGFPTFTGGKSIRRRTRVVGAFQDGQSCLNLD
jgi:hypothetical protein